MPKTLFIIITIITFIPQMYAMEMDCWFNGLPADIIKLIVFFLRGNEMTETKEEFIKRTQYMIDQKPFCTQFNTGETAFSAYCPHKDKCALLRISRNKAQLSCIKEIRPFFSIVETKNNCTLYQENFPDKEYKCIAVSQDGNMFATIHVEPEITDNYYDYCTTVPRYVSVLTIKNIFSQKIKSFDLHQHFSDPFGFTLPAIAFNKQGTLLIVHYHNNNNSPAQHNTVPKANQHKIFKNVHTQYRDVPKNSLDKYLDEYFVRHFVCKQLTQQLRLTQ